MNRVVITGLGAITPLGNDIETFWDSLVNGRSGVGLVTKFDTSGHECKIAAEVKGFDPLEHGIDRKEVRRLDIFTQYALASAQQAITDAALPLADNNPDIGVIVGTGIGGLQSIEKVRDDYQERVRNNTKNPLSLVSSFFITAMMPNAASGAISMRWKLNNTSLDIASACATGLHSIIYAAKDIMHGEAQVMIAGGSEGTITPLAYASFTNLRALTKSYNDHPQQASRPFDEKRDGFVVGEGAGVLVLESLEHALQRDARIYAEIVGYGSTSDAHHVTEPDPESTQQVWAMRHALERARLSHEGVDYVNAHGTSTQYNDLSETNAIKKVFGEHAYSLKVSANKSMMGHMLGGAGAVETIATVLTMERGIIPPTINYENPDPKCDLNYVPNTAIQQKVDVAMKNSFGFGGHNAVLVLKKYTPDNNKTAYQPQPCGWRNR